MIPARDIGQERHDRRLHVLVSPGWRGEPCADHDVVPRHDNLRMSSEHLTDPPFQLIAFDANSRRGPSNGDAEPGRTAGAPRWPGDVHVEPLATKQPVFRVDSTELRTRPQPLNVPRREEGHSAGGAGSGDQEMTTLTAPASQHGAASTRSHPPSKPMPALSL